MWCQRNTSAHCNNFFKTYYFQPVTHITQIIYELSYRKTGGWGDINYGI